MSYVLPTYVFQVVAAVALFETGCSQNAEPDAQLTAGWVTTCVGPAFRTNEQSGSSGAQSRPPVFGITDELVLAVPRNRAPYASSIDHEPPQCRQFGDVPRAHYLNFKTLGTWSTGYNPADIPEVNGQKQFQPDVVVTRIEPESPSTLSKDEKEKVDELVKQTMSESSSGTRKVGRATCYVPKYAFEYIIDCYGNRSETDPDVTKFRYFTNTPTKPFVLVQADYVSSRYGGIHVYWQAWISDVSHALDVDETVWDSIEGWNLVKKAGAPP